MNVQIHNISYNGPVANVVAILFTRSITLHNLTFTMTIIFCCIQNICNVLGSSVCTKFERIDEVSETLLRELKEHKYIRNRLSKPGVFSYRRKQ